MDLRIGIAVMVAAVLLNGCVLCAQTGPASAPNPQANGTATSGNGPNGTVPAPVSGNVQDGNASGLDDSPPPPPPG